MQNKGCAIAMKEAEFDINELFFSITDYASTIVAGNEVFVRISGYEKSEIIGKFHNIIRHPDMPKIIFKTFWDFLKAEKPIVAYVKNKTKEGGYYWVLAAVFPMNGRYISIRIKPNSSIFPIIRELYFKLLMAESKAETDVEVLLEALLKEQGFNSYEEFMSHALLAELIERKKILTTKASEQKDTLQIHSKVMECLDGLLENSNFIMYRYEKWFDKIALFDRVKETFAEKGVTLRHLARDIVFLSLNASVASYKVASGGETFGVLASDVRVNAKENDILITKIDLLAQSLSGLLNKMIFSVSAIRIQIEMMTYFIREVLYQETDVDSFDLAENLEILRELVASYTLKLSELQSQMDDNIQESLKGLTSLEQQVMYLGYIQVYGIIEAAGYQDETIGFGGIFSQLKDLIRRTSDEIVVMQKMGEDFSAENQGLIHELLSIVNVISEMQKTTKKIKSVVVA